MGWNNLLPHTKCTSCKESFPCHRQVSKYIDSMLFEVQELSVRLTDSKQQEKKTQNVRMASLAFLLCRLNTDIGRNYYRNSLPPNYTIFNFQKGGESHGLSSKSKNANSGLEQKVSSACGQRNIEEAERRPDSHVKQQKMPRDDGLGVRRPSNRTRPSTARHRRGPLVPSGPRGAGAAPKACTGHPGPARRSRADTRRGGTGSSRPSDSTLCLATSTRHHRDLQGAQSLRRAALRRPARPQGRRRRARTPTAADRKSVV